MKNKVFTSLTIVVVIIIIVVGWVFFLQRGDVGEKRFFTVEDFPNASVAITDQSVIEERVNQINQLYAEMDQPDADISYNYTRIGTLRKTLQDYQGTEEVWLKAVEMIPSSVNLGNLATLYYLELEQPEKAIDYFTQAIEFNPNNPSFHTDLAGIYRYKLGNQPEKVEGVLQMAIQNDPTSANSYLLYLVDYYDSEDNPQKVKFFLDLILENNPTEQMLEYIEVGGYDV